MLAASFFHGMMFVVRPLDIWFLPSLPQHPAAPDVASLGPLSFLSHVTKARGVAST